MRSAIGFSEKHKGTVRALGLRKLHQTVVLPESRSLRGMLIKVNHLVKIEEVK
jgi:large subunit ribosomal protein L30